MLHTPAQPGAGQLHRGAGPATALGDLEGTARAANRDRAQLGLAEVEPQRAGVAALMDRFALVAGAAEAVAAGGVEAQGTAVVALFDCALDIAAAARHAVVARGVVAQGTPSHFREGSHRLLGLGRRVEQAAGQIGSTVLTKADAGQAATGQLEVVGQPAFHRPHLGHHQEDLARIP